MGNRVITTTSSQQEEKQRVDVNQYNSFPNSQATDVWISSEVGNELLESRSVDVEDYHLHPDSNTYMGKGNDIEKQTLQNIQEEIRENEQYIDNNHHQSP